ncbi:vWA domain-containing protein [Tundrisphaera sp. TA3]|uniref:vWA domain-containing protein n=1 Tax=Tundrisphaera sp. TA3 TaxID=3435775 RepID=UPI003EBD4496
MDRNAANPASDEAGYDLAAPQAHATDPDAVATLESDNAPALEAASEAEPGPGPEPAPGGDAPAPPAETAAAAAPAPRPKRKKKKRKSRWDMPAWGVSALIHLGILGGLALVATSSGDVVKKLVDLDASMAPAGDGPEELTKIYADPAEARDNAAGSLDASTAGPTVGFSGVGSGPPSATPAITGTGRAVGERTILPSVNIVTSIGGLGMMPAAPTRDLGGGGLIGGDVTFTAGEVGDALDQITHEIRRHLTQHKVSVVWMFDESESMRDDQKAIRSKFDRVSSELKVNLPEMTKGRAKDKKSNWPPLTHAIVGFGDEVHFEQEKPTENIDAIGRAIGRLVIDVSGKENTMQALARVIGHYGSAVPKDVKLLVVLVTDESGDDGEYVEEARQAALARGVPIYVIGRQAIFGNGAVHIRYQDPVTLDTYWPTIRRGPETADVEALQYDGIRGRDDEQPSGFAPYELARLAKDTGGIYFLLPTEEAMRARQREKAYSIATLKEYVPDYESRAAYSERRLKSELRRTLYEVIDTTRSFPFRVHFPVEPGPLVEAIAEQLPVVTDRLQVLISIERRLKQLEKARNLEPERRWQAAYDLMLAQVVAFQVNAYEYRALLIEMQKQPPKLSRKPKADTEVIWDIHHSQTLKAPKQNTEKVVAEAHRLLRLVIERHPKTPWADLAQDVLDRGLGVARNEWHRNTKYEERARLVPKF